MQTIDEISIGRDGDMFTLTIYTYGPEEDDEEPRQPVITRTLLIGLPDQFHAETQRTIGQWLDNGKRRKMQAQLDAGYEPQSIRHDNPDLARDLERGK